MKKPVKKKARSSVRFKFADGDVSIPFAEVEKKVLEQLAAAAASSGPSMLQVLVAQRLQAIAVRERATRDAAAKRKKIGAATKARVAKLQPGADPAVSDRHLRRLKKRK